MAHRAKRRHTPVSFADIRAVKQCIRRQFVFNQDSILNLDSFFAFCYDEA